MSGRLGKTKRHYLYLTTNTINGKMYVGQHVTRLKSKCDMLRDGYYGSGNLIIQALKKYGRKRFHKEIIGVYDTQEDVDNAEIRFIEDMKVLENKDVWYNRSSGGQFGRSEKHSAIMSEIMREVCSRDSYRKTRGWRDPRSDDDKLRGKRIQLICLLLMLKRNKIKEYWETEEGIDFLKEYSSHTMREYVNSDKGKLYIKNHNQWQKSELGRMAMSNIKKQGDNTHEYKLKMARIKDERLPLNYYHISCIDQGILPNKFDTHFGRRYYKGEFVTLEGLKIKCDQLSERATSLGFCLNSDEMVEKYAQSHGRDM